MKVNRKHFLVLLSVFVLVIGVLAGLLVLFLDFEYKCRVSKLEPLITTVSIRHNVDPNLIKAVIRQETDFKVNARGAAGERGLMQIMPPVVEDWERLTGGKLSSIDDLFRPEVNIEIGTWYLARALNQFNHHPESVVLALSQYNAGRSRALAWEKEYQENILKHIPYSSTRHYITMVIKYRDRYEAQSRTN